jgi:hypothetical protein
LWKRRIEISYAQGNGMGTEADPYVYLYILTYLQNLDELVRPVVSAVIAMAKQLSPVLCGVWDENRIALLPFFHGCCTRRLKD